jgi:putative endonuclease
MIVYLLHFDSPISQLHTSQHYIGSCVDLDKRIAEHRSGMGARFCAVAKERNIGFTVARTWQADRAFERQLKRRKCARRMCPICKEEQ